VKKVSVPFFFSPPKNPVPLPGLRELQKLNYPIHARERFLFNFILSNHGLSVDNLYGTLKNIF